MLATLVSGGDEASQSAKLLVRADRTTLGTLGCPGADAAVLAEVAGMDAIPEDLLKVMDLEGEAAEDRGALKVFLESICPEPTLYLFGGGHVSFAIARVAHTVGFRIVVIDDRPMFATGSGSRWPMRRLRWEMETAV